MGGPSPCHHVLLLRGMEVRKMVVESRSCVVPASTEHPAPVVLCFQLVSLLSPKPNIWPLSLPVPQLEMTLDPHFVMLRAIPNLKEQNVHMPNCSGCYSYSCLCFCITKHGTPSSQNTRVQKNRASGKLSRATGLFSQHCTARGEVAAFSQVSSLLAEFQALLL